MLMTGVIAQLLCPQQQWQKITCNAALMIAYDLFHNATIVSWSTLIHAMQRGGFAASSLRLGSRLEQVGQKLVVVKTMPFTRCYEHLLHVYILQLYVPVAELHENKSAKLLGAAIGIRAVLWHNTMHSIVESTCCAGQPAHGISRHNDMLLNCQSRSWILSGAMHLHAAVYLSLNMRLSSSSVQTDVHAEWNIWEVIADSRLYVSISSSASACIMASSSESMSDAMSSSQSGRIAPLNAISTDSSWVWVERALSRLSTATASATCSEQSSLCCPAEANHLVRVYLDGWGLWCFNAVPQGGNTKHMCDTEYSNLHCTAVQNMAQVDTWPTCCVPSASLLEKEGIIQIYHCLWLQVVDAWF